MASITFENIEKEFGKTKVLQGINLHIQDGEFISLLGASGCGKSTLLRILSGLERQSRGSILIGGANIDATPPKDRGVAMVFQSYALYPHLSVFDNIAVPLRMRTMTTIQRMPLVGPLWKGCAAARHEINHKVLTVAESLDIASLLNRKPAQLSGGQRQRVALARAMVRAPKVFLMDEPLSNLDAKMRIHMRSELKELHRRLNATFVYVTHDQEEAMTMSDRIALMMDGKLMQVAAPSTIYSRPSHIRVAAFIGSPQINILPGNYTEPGVMDVLGCHLPCPHGLTGAGSLGIRPSRLTLLLSDKGQWRATVVNVENLGSSLLVHCLIDETHRVICRMDNRMRWPDVGETVALGMQEGQGMFFDADGWRKSTPQEDLSVWEQRYQNNEFARAV